MGRDTVRREMFAPGPRDGHDPSQAARLVLDFEPSGEGCWRVAARTPGGGRGRGRFEIPAEASRLAEVAERLTASRAREVVMEHRGEPVVGGLEQLGEALFRALFRGEVLELYRSCSQRAAVRRGLLRIQLELGASDALLQALPWEALRDSGDDHFLALDGRVSVVRHLQLRFETEPSPRPRRVRVLVAATAPPGGGLDLDGERRALERAVGGGEVELEILPRATLGDLVEAVEAKGIHVVHYAGHGEVGSDGRGLLYLDEPGGGNRAVAASDLAQLCRRAPLRLVFLNACRTADAPAAAPHAGAAAALLRIARVPAVIAMQYPVSDSAAQTFAAEVYRQLADGHGIDRAVVEGRRKLAQKCSPEWVTPVLFSRLRDGRLFDDAEGASTGEAAPSPGLVVAEPRSPRPAPVGATGGEATPPDAGSERSSSPAAETLSTDAPAVPPGGLEPLATGASTLRAGAAAAVLILAGTLAALSVPGLRSGFQETGVGASLPAGPADGDAAGEVGRASPDRYKPDPFGGSRTGADDGEAAASAGAGSPSDRPSPTPSVHRLTGSGSAYLEELAADLSAEFHRVGDEPVLTLHLSSARRPAAVLSEGRVDFETASGTASVLVTDIDWQDASLRVRAMLPPAPGDDQELDL